MSNKSESDKLQVLIDNEMALQATITTQISTLTASGVNYTIGDQHFDFTAQLMALTNNLNDSLDRIEKLYRFQNIKNPYYLVNRGC